MSTPVPRPASVIQATRHQLDELDALIQRMLTLPDNPDAGDLATELPALALPPFVQVEAVPPAPPSAVPSPDDPDAEPVTVGHRPEGLLDPVPEVGATEQPVPDVEDQPEALAGPSPEPARTPRGRPRAAAGTAKWGSAVPGYPWWVRLLVRGNQAFDACTLPFGAPGRWLRVGWGRDLLGWAGVLGVAAAVAWGVLDWVLRNW